MWRQSEETNYRVPSWVCHKTKLKNAMTTWPTVVELQGQTGNTTGAVRRAAASAHRKEPNYVVLTKMPPGHLLLEVFRAHPTGKWSWGRPRRCCRDYININWIGNTLDSLRRSWKIFQSEFWSTLLILPPPDPASDKKHIMNGWMDGWMPFHVHAFSHSMLTLQGLHLQRLKWAPCNKAVTSQR